MRKRLTALAAMSAAALFATACTSSDATTGAEGSDSDDGELNIVTSTSIWGDVASAVVTDESATVTPIIEGNATDPHHFEPSAADLARASEADIVVVGGGGYDAWLYEVVDEEKIVHPLPLVEHSHDHGEEHEHDHDHAHDHEHEGEEHAENEHAGHEHGEVETIDGNEHIWYDTDAVSLVAEDIEAAAREINPEVQADAQPVLDRMEAMEAQIAELPEGKVAQSESVGDYILADSKLEDITPESYRAAILSESEPAAADLAEFLDTLNSGDVDLLIFNAQTATDTAKRIRDSAEENGVSIVEINETPDADVNFLDYFENSVQALADAI